MDDLLIDVFWNLKLSLRHSGIFCAEVWKQNFVVLQQILDIFFIQDDKAHSGNEFSALKFQKLKINKKTLSEHLRGDDSAAQISQDNSFKQAEQLLS